MTTTETFPIAMQVILTVPYPVWRFTKIDDFAPLVIVRIIGAVLPGPGVLGAAFPDYYQFVFTQPVVQSLNGLAWWGVMLAGPGAAAGKTGVAAPAGRPAHLRYASLDDIAIWGVLAVILLDWERVGRQLGFLLVFALVTLPFRTGMLKAQEKDRWYFALVGEASIIGWLLQSKGLIEIVFANILLDKQIITSDTFTALLLMAVASTMLTVPMVAPELLTVSVENSVNKGERWMLSP